MDNVVALSGRVDKIEIEYTHLHKKKNDLKESCVKQGERIGELEVETAVQDNRIVSVETAVKSIESQLRSLPIKTIGGVGMILGIIEALRRLA